MIPIIILAQALLALLFVAPARAVFSDEAGVSDWHRKSLGLLKASPAPDLYYAKHQSDHVVARLNSTDGSIVWRKLFSFESSGSESPTLSTNAQTGALSKFFTVGFSGKDTCKLTSFDTNSGSLNWELTVAGECIDSTFANTGATGSSILYSLTKSALYKIDGVTGTVLSYFTPELLHAPFEFVGLSPAGIILEDTSAGSILEYKFPTNQESQSKTHRDPFANAPLVYGPGSLLGYSDSGALVWQEEPKNSPESPAGAILLGSKSVLLDTPASSPVTVAFVGATIVAVIQDQILKAYSSDSLSLLYTIENVILVSCVDAASFAIVKTDSIDIVDAKTGKTVSSRPLSYSPGPTVLTSEYVRYSNGVVEPVGSNKWSRDESLAQIDAALILDYPDNRPVSLDVKEALYEEHANLYVAYGRRLARHANDLAWLVQKVAENPRALLSWSWLTGATDADGEASNNDIYFGFKKYFVAVSQTGRVQALDSTKDGATVWAKDLFSARDEAGAKFLMTVLDETIVIVDPNTNQVVSLNGLTGEILNQAAVSLGDEESIERILELYLPGAEQKSEEDIESASAEERTKVPVLWTSANKLYSLDGSVFTSPLPIYISKTAADKASLVGYRVDGSSLYQSWELNVPSGHVIQNVAARHELDLTVNIGQVLSDRSVLYKYLHKNLLAVTATGPGSLYVYLVDSVTGRILHSKHHDTGAGIDSYTAQENTHLVVGENWIVYTFWSSMPTLGQVIVVWDLYESEIPNERTMAKLNSKQKLESAPYSSFENYAAPHVKSQAYYAPGQHSRITSLGVTRTRYGVTVRDVIAATSRHHILSLPKRGGYLSARRPVDKDPSAAEAAEEGLTRYDSLLGYDAARQVLSHTRQVLGISALLSAPTVLESTSAVVGYGLDIFGTKVAPSGLFDVLTPSFGRSKLLYTLLGMTGLLMYLKPLVGKRKTNNLWGL